MNTDPVAHALFETSIGPCAIAWTAAGVVWIQLPASSHAATAKRLDATLVGRPRSDETPPAWIESAIGELRAHLDGRAADLETIRLDPRGVPPFFRRVYDAARAVPRGEVRSYAEIAQAAGSPFAFRAVGQAMAKNPWPIVVPCHRVVGSGGKAGGFSAPGGLDTKARLLAIEGAPDALGAAPAKTRPPAPRPTRPRASASRPRARG